MEVPIQLQQITSSTLMSSAVAICVNLRAIWKYFTWLIIYVYTLGLIYTLDQGVGNLRSQTCTIYTIGKTRGSSETL